MPRGGKRIGAGRPRQKEETFRVQILLNREDKAKFKELGGVKWVRRKLKEDTGEGK